MRKIVTAAFVSLDGVMQAPGGPDEDPSGGFEYGGWIVPLFDDVVGAAVDELFATPFDLLLGRTTYDIFAAHWPFVETDPEASGYDEDNARLSKRFDAATKFVATHRPESLAWQNTRALGADVVRSLRELKQQDGPTLVTQGSSALVQTLLANDLIDELRVITFPVTLGRGKRLFGDGARPAGFAVVRSSVSPRGAVIAVYRRGGDVKTGSFALDKPTPAELERRRNTKARAIPTGPSHASPTSAVVRYHVADVDRAIAFYTDVLGFELAFQAGKAFATVRRGDLHLLLGGPGSSGSRPMPDGRQQEPGGWNRIVMFVDDLPVFVERLAQRDVVFRNQVESGPGGSQIQIEDPDGNPIEIHQPANKNA